MSAQKIRDILRIGARYIVARALFHSGMRMVLNLAGIHSGPVEWVTPFGEFSGAQFAGIWLGVSPIFQTLGGLVEVVAGLFLLIPRFTTVGALIAVGCFINSLMLDFCFRPSPWVGDVLLLLPSIYLVLLDWRVLINLLLLDRPTTPISTDVAWATPQTWQDWTDTEDIDIGLFHLRERFSGDSDEARRSGTVGSFRGLFRGIVLTA